MSDLVCVSTCDYPVSGYHAKSGGKVLCLTEEEAEQQLRDFSNIYPLVIFKARYGGSYEGAEWIALDATMQHAYLAQGDDISCANFFHVWQAAGRKIGRGKSPQEAAEDLARKLKNADKKRS